MKFKATCNSPKPSFVFANCFSKTFNLASSISMFILPLKPFNFSLNPATALSSFEGSTLRLLNASASSFPACFPNTLIASKSFVIGFNFSSMFSAARPPCTNASFKLFPVSLAVFSTFSIVLMVSFSGFITFSASMPIGNIKSLIFLFFRLLLSCLLYFLALAFPP